MGYTALNTLHVPFHFVLLCPICSQFCSCLLTGVILLIKHAVVQGLEPHMCIYIPLYFDWNVLHKDSQNILPVSAYGMNRELVSYCICSIPCFCHLGGWTLPLSDYIYIYIHTHTSLSRDQVLLPPFGCAAKYRENSMLALAPFDQYLRNFISDGNLKWALPGGFTSFYDRDTCM